MAAKKKTTEETPEQRTAPADMDTEQARQTASAPEEDAHAGQTTPEQMPEAAEIQEAPTNPQEDVEGTSAKDSAPQETGTCGRASSALESLSVLADRHRVAGWQQAALLRLMGWEDDKRVSDAEYRAALENLKQRRIGGGRR